MEKLTSKQTEVLNALKKFIAKNNYPPTVREIGQMVGLASPSTVHFHLDKLEEKNYIKRLISKNRAIEILVDNEYLEKKSISIPLLGEVIAGNPATAFETPYDTIELPVSMIPKNKKIFSLKVTGESMIKAGINEGDILVVQEQKEAKNGDIVVAMTDEYEATVKTFYKEKDHIRLQPENDNMDPIILKNCIILGKVISIHRFL